MKHKIAIPIITLWNKSFKKWTENQIEKANIDKKVLIAIQM